MACYLKGTSCTCGKGGGEKKTDAAAFKENSALTRVTCSQPWSLKPRFTHRDAENKQGCPAFALGGLGP